jgi:hypothetical protein
MIVAEEPAEPSSTPDVSVGRPKSFRCEELIVKSLVVALAVVQVDNPTLIVLSGEKSVIRGIHGSVVQSPYTRCLSNVSSPCVGAVSSRSGIVEP